MTRGALPARRISCFPFCQADFDNWTAKGKVLPVQAVKACIGSGGVTPLILKLDTKLRRNNLLMGAEGVGHRCSMGAGFASSPFYSCYGFVSRSSVQSVGSSILLPHRRPVPNCDDVCMTLVCLGRGGRLPLFRPRIKTCVSLVPSVCA